MNSLGCDVRDESSFLVCVWFKQPCLVFPLFPRFFDVSVNSSTNVIAEWVIVNGHHVPGQFFSCFTLSLGEWKLWLQDSCGF